MARGWFDRKKVLPVTQGGKPTVPVDADQLYCYGCLHSAVVIPYPSMPSGERPCQFCIRNRQREDPQTSGMPRVWYDGSEPISIPMDAYQTLDMRDQYLEWLKNAMGPSEEERQAVLERLLVMRETASS